LLVVAYVESVGQIMVNIALATHVGVSHILFGILQVDSLSPSVNISFLLSYPFLIGLLVANGEDGAFETGWKN
jgi:hypothetical protein